MTSTANAACQVEGAKNLASVGGEREICEVFSRRLAEVLDDHGDVADLSISLSVTAGGTIDAVVIDAGVVDAGADGRIAMSVDVMDRALQRTDVETLAEAVGKAMVEARTAPRKPQTE